jgi:hypothetical protein
MDLNGSTKQGSCPADAGPLLARVTNPRRVEVNWLHFAGVPVGQSERCSTASLRLPDDSIGVERLDPKPLLARATDPRRVEINSLHLGNESTGESTEFADRGSTMRLKGTVA